MSNFVQLVLFLVTRATGRVEHSICTEPAHRGVLRFVSERVRERERERERLEQCGSAPVPILFGQAGRYGSAGHSVAKDWWRMTHPTSSDENGGSRQRV